MSPSDAVELAGRHHYSILFCFLIGYLLHVGLQVDAIATSKNNPVNSRWMIVIRNGWRLAGRFFISLMIFLYVWKNPSTAPTIIGYFGVQLSANAIAILTLPMSPPVSGMMGFAVDSLLAYIPVLKNALPAIEFTQVETTVKETHKTETHTVVTPLAAPDKAAGE